MATKPSIASTTKTGQWKESVTVLTAKADFSLVNEETPEASFISDKGSEAYEKPAQAMMAYGLDLSFDTCAQRDEALAVLQNLPELHHELRKRSIGSAIIFLEDKPEIYNHDSLAFHLLGNARLRNEFMREVGALTSQQVAELGQSQAKNRSAHAHRVKTENKIFAVEFQGDDRYPAFQFDPQTGKPKPVIKQILEVVKGQWTGWQLALWFVTANGYLDDKIPMECLDETPDKVLEALRKEAGEVEF